MGSFCFFWAPAVGARYPVVEKRDLIMYCVMYSRAQFIEYMDVSGHLFVSKDTSAGSGHCRGDPVRCLTFNSFFFLGRLQLLT